MYEKQDVSGGKNFLIADHPHQVSSHLTGELAVSCVACVSLGFVASSFDSEDLSADMVAGGVSGVVSKVGR